jgi:hypothetical protein
VKQSEPNALRLELARSQQAGPHPDADVLTAFSENALLDRERKEVMAHLAVCADCREVLSIATSAAPGRVAETQPQLLPPATLSPLRAWLPWVATAAAVVIAASAVLIHQQNLRVKSGSNQTANVATKELVPPAAATDQQSQLSVPLGPKAVRQKPSPQSASSVSKPAMPSPPIEAPSLAAKLGETPEEPLRPIGGTQLNTTSVAAAPTAEVAAQSVEASPVPAQPMSQSHAALAGALRGSAMSKATSGTVARPHWRINENGQPERSFGNGPWQAVLPNELTKMRVVSVSGNDVWVGGENLRLFHSSDNGTTWTLVALPDKNDREHAITHILFQTEQTGAVDSDDGTSWTTTDGGVTWK